MTLLFGLGGKKGVLPHPLKHMPVHRLVNRRVLRLQPRHRPIRPPPMMKGLTRGRWLSHAPTPCCRTLYD